MQIKVRYNNHNNHWVHINSQSEFIMDTIFNFALRN